MSQHLPLNHVTAQNQAEIETKYPLTLTKGSVTPANPLDPILRNANQIRLEAATPKHRATSRTRNPKTGPMDIWLSITLTVNKRRGFSSKWVFIETGSHQTYIDPVGFH